MLFRAAACPKNAYVVHVRTGVNTVEGKMLQIHVARLLRTAGTGRLTSRNIIPSPDAVLRPARRTDNRIADTDFSRRSVSDCTKLNWPIGHTYLQKDRSGKETVDRGEAQPRSRQSRSRRSTTGCSKERTPRTPRGSQRVSTTASHLFRNCSCGQLRPCGSQLAPRRSSRGNINGTGHAENACRPPASPGPADRAQ